MTKTKPNTKAVLRAKQNRRRTLTFMRMCRYGVTNFSRNAWLTVAATAVMSVTLLIIFITLSSRHVLLRTVDELSTKVDYSIYLRSEVAMNTVDELKAKIEQLDNIKGVSYVSSDAARKDLIEQNKQNADVLEAIKEARNRLPAILKVQLVNVNDTSVLDDFIKSDVLYKKVKDPNLQPSFIGDRRQSIKRITEGIQAASVGGAIATAVFVIISALVVFNTIRMAIFNRRDEIQMMKLIGAERSFIRGPFVVEAVMYGFIAAIIATIVGYGLLHLAREPMGQFVGEPMDNLLQSMMLYGGLIFLAMVCTGAIIGVTSSLIATRKYLKL